jgi:hypothetical protein
VNIPEDKKKHLLAGLMISIGTMFMPVIWSFMVVVMVGVGKEIYDKVSGKGTPEILDAIATVLGAIPVIAVRFFI